MRDGSRSHTDQWLSGRESLRRIKWVAVLAPLIFLTAVELVRQFLDPRLVHSLPGYLLLAGIILLGAFFFAQLIFGIVGSIQQRLSEQNHELLALHESGLAITGELELELVLQQIVDEARDLVGARYGALALLHRNRVSIELEGFITSGISLEQRKRLGPLPVGHGLLGMVLEEARPLRLDDLTRHPRSVGFPPEHPAMFSLVAVPIMSHDRVLGSLYLTEKENARAFDEADEARLKRFATQAALAIENARLHHQVRELAITEERDRIAREMHDSLAQVLGYVNTKAQAAQVFIDSGQPDQATRQIGQLAQAAREAYADVRENILGLRTSLSPEKEFLDSLREYMESWQDQSGTMTIFTTVPETGFTLDLSPLAELQILRIIQESLSNVRKHADATKVEIRLEKADDFLEATVKDNGKGFDPDVPGRSTFPRFGLNTMRERAEAAGGTLEITSTPGKGTCVTIHVPFSAEHRSVSGGSHARTHR